MTTVAEPEVLQGVPADPPSPQRAPGPEPVDGAEQRPQVLSLAGAAFCSSVAAMLLVGGLFQGVLPRLIAVVVPAVGVGLVAYGIRSRRLWPQLAAIPVGAVLGAVLVVPETNGQGSSNIVDAVLSAIRGGGLLQPPVSFDPGWRFIVTLIACGLGAGTLAGAAAFAKPRLAVVIPVPLAMLAEFVQPKSTEVIGTAVAAVLIVGALGFSYGAELQAEGAVRTGSFELRRMARTGSLAVGLLVAILALGQTSFLFPQPNRNDVTPPQKPHAAPPQADRALFTYQVQNGNKIPFRIGTIDIYDPKQNAWLLPPYDTNRLHDISNGQVPGGPPAKGSTYTVTVTIADAQGHVLPAVYGTARISGLSAPIKIDPRTGILQLSDRPVGRGMTYQLKVAAPPTGQALATAGKPEAAYAQFLQVPTPPLAVQDLLSKAPADPFDRMQYLRNALLTKVVASGAGTPVDLPVSRVPQMLKGAQASPYEITAAEALLARWAGVPSRIGYGYYDGPALKNGAHEMRPKNGATWLEAYFKGYGWVPVVGVPQQAKSSADNNDKNRNDLIRPASELSVVIYVATRDTSPLLYFQIVGYYLGLVLPWVVLAVLLLIAHPALVKVVRFVARRRWAAKRGPAARILVAYTEFRDLANDLTYGDPTATPLEYLNYVQDDVEHADLAWLVTRAMWGDMRRDLTEEDAAHAEALSRSLIRRLARAQNVVNLVSAAIARTSLRQPFSDAPPRMWPRRRSTARPGIRARLRSLRRKTWRARVAGLLGLFLLAGCGGDSQFRGPHTLRSGLTPASIGDLSLVRNARLERQYLTAASSKVVTQGEVWLVHEGDVIQGSVQISLLAPDVRADDPSVRAGLDDGIGGVAFTPVLITSDQLVWVKQEVNQRVYLWFPPRSNAIELVILRLQFKNSLSLVKGLVDYQHGRKPQGASPSPSASTGASG